MHTETNHPSPCPLHTSIGSTPLCHQPCRDQQISGELVLARTTAHQFLLASVAWCFACDAASATVERLALTLLSARVRSAAGIGQHKGRYSEVDTIEVVSPHTASWSP